MAVGEVRPGYELWRPNREKSGSVTTKFVIVLLLLATAVLAAVITIGGWSLLKGGGAMGLVCIIYAVLYAFFAFRVARWSRGVIPLSATSVPVGWSRRGPPSFFECLASFLRVVDCASQACPSV